MYVRTFMSYVCALRRFLSNKCKSMKDLLNTDKIRYLYIIISYMYVYIGDILAS